MSRAEAAHWEFARRFRRGAFGWKSQPAIERVRQAVSEIKTVARRDPVLGAEGAVLFLERVSPALEHVDSSSGAIGTAVNHAIEGLMAVIARAPVDARTREGWLERLWEAHANDAIPYIERLGDFLGRALRVGGNCLRMGRSACPHRGDGAEPGPGAARLLSRHDGVPERALPGVTPRGHGSNSIRRSFTRWSG